MNLVVAVHQGSWVEIVGTQREGMIVGDIVGVGNIEADTGVQEDRCMAVVSMAVNKQPLVVCKVLVKRIHNPHLVKHYT